MLQGDYVLAVKVFHLYLYSKIISLPTSHAPLIIQATILLSLTTNSHLRYTLLSLSLVATVATSLTGVLDGGNRINPGPRHR